MTRLEEHGVIRRKTMAATNHELKCWIEYFNPMCAGRKTFDLRHDDRGFKLGDLLTMKEFDKDKNEFTGREALFRVVYLLKQPEGCRYQMLAEDAVILGVTFLSPLVDGGE